MDYSINKETLAIGEIVFDGCQEQPIDLDFNLPDYCPDIQRILKCQVYPHINSKNISADRLDVDGTSIIKLLYLDSENNKIRCCEYSSPFSTSFNLNSSSQNSIAQTCTRVEYINCRAISPRRLDIHGAFSVCAKVISKSEQEFTCNIDEPDIQQKKFNATASNLIGTGQQQFSINEVMELGSGKPQVESIIRSDAKASIADYKIISNKLIIKGELFVKVLYMSDISQGTLEVIEYSVPISQIIDIIGINDKCACIINMEIMNHDIQIRSDSSGENNLLEINAKISATAEAFEEKELQLISDAYSTAYNLDTTYNNININHLIENINDTYIGKENFEFPESGISKVLDVWSELCSVTAKYHDNQIVFNGKINICILAVDNEDSPFFEEKTIEFEHMHDWNLKPKQINCDASCLLESLGYRIIGSDGIEVRIEIKLSANVYENETHKAIEKVFADEGHPKKKDSTNALTIYYADNGESIWDIARKYSTSVDAIKLENDLSEDILQERSMLLIPM